MNGRKEIEIANLMWEILEENMPTDCKDIIYELRKRFFKDVRDMGFKDAVKKWVRDEDEVDIIIS